MVHLLLTSLQEAERVCMSSSLEWHHRCIAFGCINNSLCVLVQESGLLNRPEIPHLASLNRPLLVKAYDLGFVDAKGKTETRVIADMLAAAQQKVCAESR